MGEAPHPAERTSISARPITVLVVDDEAMIRKVVGLILRRKGYRVLEAEDGEDALSHLAARDDIDLVLSDVRMPRLDGIGLVRALRLRTPAMPVLLMSGYTGHVAPALAEDDLRLLLSKPFTPEQLVARVQAALPPAP